VVRLVFFSVQKVSNAAELLRRMLQRFDLLSQLRLFGLLFAEHFMDISHGAALLMEL
jgi:hypothetical protein